MDRTGETFDYCRTAMRATAGELLLPLQESGVVRADIGVTELLRLSHAVSIAAEEDGVERAHRLLDIMIAGLGLPTRPVA